MAHKSFKIDFPFSDVEDKNIRDTAEQIALGPQRDVLESVEKINQSFGSSFRITPTFRWGPGIYNHLREMTEILTRVGTKKNKVSTYFNQIDNNRWRYERFKDYVKGIDNRLFALRQSNSIFQDNSDMALECFKEFKDKLEETIISSENVREDITITPYFGNCSYPSNSGVNHSRRIVGPCIIYEIALRDVVTTILLGGTKVPVPMGSIKLMISVNLMQMLTERIRARSANINVNDPSEFRLSTSASMSHTSVDQGAIFRELEHNIRFPYISRNPSYDSHIILNRVHFQQVCFGHFARNLNESLWRGNLLTSKILLGQWAETYNVGSTGPLNNYKEMYHGVWPAMDNERWRAAGALRNANDCRYNDFLTDIQPEIEEAYCTKYECILRSTCDSYKYVYEGHKDAVASEILNGPEYCDHGIDLDDICGDCIAEAEEDADALRVMNNADGEINSEETLARHLETMQAEAEIVSNNGHMSEEDLLHMYGNLGTRIAPIQTNAQITEERG